ncbi:LCP family protein [Adlercreutzia shanghongiae]|uniref:LCP family protein n=1 Tax=Adlercreutzia shanghongiae TaxID=3111773 RepID=A0ABU6J094_9ACTN|nr:LCP family protein [Adlercreutzia sp. R22]MEC4295564.1 LCP family protein [Adlercreutzia sp. R22]
MALHGRKASSASRTRRVTRRVNDSMIGSHVERSPSGRPRHAASAGAERASRVDFSDSRRSRRANRGMVEQVDVAATSGESDSDFARRRSRRGYVEEIQARTRRRKMAFLGAVAALVVVVAAVAGTMAFFAWSDSQLSLGDSNAKEALVAAEDGAASYALLVADLTTGATAPNDTDKAYMAVRIDAASRVLTFVTIPSSVAVELSDGERHALSDAQSVGGDAELLRAAGALLGIEFSHFASTNAEGLSRLVDIVGGVPVELSEEVDDPRAGTRVLAAGAQTLDGAQALTLLRASNYADALETQAKMRALFTVNLAERAASGEGLAFPSVVADGSAFVSTDWTSGQIIAMGDAFSPLTDATVYAAVVPGRTVDGEDGAPATFEVAGDELASMMEAVKSGQSPQAAEADLANVDRSLVTVEVRNGSGIQGAAARCGELLTSDGYEVASVGNVDDGAVYPETLVIYKDEAFEIAAKAIVSDLSAGRVVNGGDFYHFDTNVLVIIGSDWIG